MQIAIAGNSSAAYYCLEKLCRAGYNIAAVITPEKNAIKSLDTADFNSLSGEFDFRQITVPLKKDVANNTQIDILIKLEWPENLDIPITPTIASLNSNLSGQFNKEYLTDVAADLYNGKSKFECQLILEYANDSERNSSKIESINSQQKIISCSEIEINLFDDIRSVKTKTLAHYYWLLLELLNIINNGGKIPEPLSKEYYSNSVKAVRNIDWNQSTKNIYNLIRSLTHPGTGAYTWYEGDRINIWRGHHFEKISNGFENIAPGTIVDILDEIGVLVKAGDGLFLITRVQPSGAPELPAWIWADDSHVRPFEVFGNIEKNMLEIKA